MRPSNSRLRQTLRTVFVLAALVLVAGACAPGTTLPPSPTARPAVPPELVLLNGTLIDGTGSDPLPDAVVVIGGGRILAVGPRGSVAVPEGVPAIDVRG